MTPSPRPFEGQLRLVAWELTRCCNLRCVHCRAGSQEGPYPGELDTATVFRILKEIREVGTPIVILTGGEPLLREDLLDLAREGTRLGLRMVLATNGTLLTLEWVAHLKEAGIQRVSISLDGANAERHDAFRQVPGAFEGALGGIRSLREGGLEFQVNTTVTTHNVDELPAIMRLAEDLGAVAHHLFLLVPTGRGRELKEQAIDAERYEEVLRWFCVQRERTPLQLKATCAPHYYRILREEARKKGVSVDMKTYGLDAVTRGCLGGVSFCFISHEGVVQPCGYLEIPCGDLRSASFGEIWQQSRVFARLRDPSRYQGKCGRCEYLRVCGGCRARAYEASGDYMAPEPLCAYEPRKRMQHE